MSQGLEVQTSRTEHKWRNQATNAIDYSPILLSMIPDLNRNLLRIILPTEKWLYADHANRLLFLTANVAPQFNPLVQKGNKCISPPMVRYRSSYNMPWKYRERNKGKILFGHNFGARRGWVANVTPQPLYLREREPAPGSHCTGGWVGPWTVTPDYASPVASPPMDMFRFPSNRWNYTGGSLLSVITRTSVST